MSERAAGLRDAVSVAMEGCVGDIERTNAVLRAIVEELGAGTLRETVSSLRFTASTFGPNTSRHQQWTARADTLSTLLEAAGEP